MLDTCRPVLQIRMVTVIRALFCYQVTQESWILDILAHKHEYVTLIIDLIDNQHEK